MDRLRGIADTILFLAPKLSGYPGRPKEASNSAQPAQNELIEFLSWFDITWHCSLGSDRSSDSLVLKIHPEFHSPSKCISLAEKQILVVSPNFRKAIADLSEVWHNPRAKTVLLCAYTGSGKEVLVDDILTRTMMIGEHKLSISAAALGTFEALRKKLNSSKELLLLRPAASTRPRKAMTTGQRSVLFLDEIHHDSAGPLREGLLRLLSTGRLESEGKSSELACDAILYVLAASELPDTLRAHRHPKDLWTRMEHTVTLHHPLDVKNDGERSEVLREHFLFFWRAHHKVFTESPQRNAYSTGRFLPIPNEDNEGSRTALHDLAGRFVRILGSPLLPLISIRLLDTMVKRLFYRTVDYLRHNPELRRASDATVGMSQEFDRWVEHT